VQGLKVVSRWLLEVGERLLKAGERWLLSKVEASRNPEASRSAGLPIHVVKNINADILATNILSTKHQTQSTKHQAPGTKHKAPGTKHSINNKLIKNQKLK